MGGLNKLESLHNNYFLGADLEERKLSLTSWKKVLSHKQFEGFSVSNMLLLKIFFFIYGCVTFRQILMLG